MKSIALLLIIFSAYSAATEITFSQNPDEFSTKEIEKFSMPDIHSFPEATQWADLVAIAQVDDIEYEKVRNLNAKGYAFLDILVAYKGATRGEPVAVIATGFEDNICYYPDRKNEGERYLVFLKKAPNHENNVYYGFKPFCQMQILLSELGQYILRTPLDTKLVSIDESMIEKHQFNDPHAIIDATLWTGIKREAFADEYQCKIIESSDTFNKYFHIQYTKGVPIYKVRPLLELPYKARIKSDQI